jgi:hypothetical protein
MGKKHPERKKKPGFLVKYTHWVRRFFGGYPSPRSGNAKACELSG